MKMKNFFRVQPWKILNNIATIGTMAVSTKPPIIQVLTDSLSDRSNCISSLQRLVQSDRYIISDFDGDPVNGSWSLLGQRECILLVVIGEINNNVYSCILDFVKNGGNVFSICSNLFRKFFPECSFTQVNISCIRVYAQTTHGVLENTQTCSSNDKSLHSNHGRINMDYFLGVIEGVLL